MRIYTLLSVGCLITSTGHATYPVQHEKDETSCEAPKNPNVKTSSVDDDRQILLREALRRFVQGYASSKKAASFSSILEDVNLLLKDKLPPEIIEKIVTEAINDNTAYADQLIMNMLETVADPDCMSREFDVSGSTFNTTEAALVMHKCKLLVLRNVFDMDILQGFKKDFTAYVRGLDSGRIPKTGRTTNNEDYFMDKLDWGRWELLIPKDLAEAEVVRNKHILNILLNEKLLGSSLALHSMGAAIADSGATPQDWHTDSDYIFGDDLYGSTGITHHELPAYAITMMVPLLHMTPDHGPTQFCMGSSNLAGLNDYEHNREAVNLRNESLRPYLYAQPDLDLVDDYTPCKWMRTPLITFGDALLFDYQIVHRGGRNTSPYLRSMLYLTYSRFWYKDEGFDDDLDDDDEEEDERKDYIYKLLTKTTRFAIPDKLNDDDIDGSLLSEEESDLESLGSFRGLPNGDKYY